MYSGFFPCSKKITPQNLNFQVVFFLFRKNNTTEFVFSGFFLSDIYFFTSSRLLVVKVHSS